MWERAGDAVDIQQACVEEAALLQGPVSAVKKRLQHLLQEWPEHPVLDQLLAICHRLTGALTHPLATTLGPEPKLPPEACQQYRQYSN